jgi:uncharacterized protein YegP (UPF0339 family)
MKEARMVEYWFEIFRQNVDRWAWRFVVLRDGERRVLARSGRDFRSRRRARRSIRRLRSNIQGAPIIVVGQGGFPLPATTFALVPGVVPLPVQGSPDEFEPAGARQSLGTGGAPLAELRTQNGEPVQAQEQAPQPRVQQEPAKAATPEPPAAQEQAPEPEQEKKPTPRRGGRKAKAT